MSALGDWLVSGTSDYKAHVWQVHEHVFRHFYFISGNNADKSPGPRPGPGPSHASQITKNIGIFHLSQHSLKIQTQLTNHQLPHNHETIVENRGL